MIDGKMLAIKYAKTKDANKDSQMKSEQAYSSPDAKNSYHIECMRKFIEAVHNKHPQHAHAAIVDYARGEPERMDAQGRTRQEEQKDAKMSIEEEAKHYRNAQYRK